MLSIKINEDLQEAHISMVSLEAKALRLETIAGRLEAIASSLEAIASNLEDEDLQYSPAVAGGVRCRRETHHLMRPASARSSGGCTTILATQTKRPRNQPANHV